MYPLPTKRYTALGKGRVGHYLEGEGHSVLCIHGFPTNAFLWSAFLPSLAHLGYEVGAPDLMGLGDTLYPGGQDMSLESQGVFLYQYHHELLSNPSAVLVGHELGAALALTLALQKPGMVRALVLISPIFFDRWPVGVMKPLKLPAKIRPLFSGLFRSGVAQRSMRKTLQEGFFDSAKMERQTSCYIEEFLRPLVNSPSASERMRTLLSHLNPKLTQTFSKYLHRVSVPTLIIHGEKDPFVPASLPHKLGNLIEGAQVASLKECGHFAPAEQPEPIVSLVNQFMGQLPES